MIQGSNHVEANVVTLSTSIPARAKAGLAGIRDDVYLPDQRELQITFISGRPFAYANVPQSMYDAFLASASKGAFFNIAIRGRFQFREMTLPVDATRRSSRSNG